MFKQRPFPFAIISLVVFLSLHVAGSYFDWYWTYRWLDIPVHILSGLCLSLMILWIMIAFGQIKSIRDYKIKSLAVVLVVTGGVAFLWEVYEIYTGITSTANPGYGLDTGGDILNGLIGALIAYLYFIKTKKCSSTSIVNVCDLGSVSLTQK